MRDRIGSRVWDAAESLKVSPVAPAVVCQGQEAGKASQSEKRSGLPHIKQSISDRLQTRTLSSSLCPCCSFS